MITFLEFKVHNIDGVCLVVDSLVDKVVNMLKALLAVVVLALDGILVSIYEAFTDDGIWNLLDDETIIIAQLLLPILLIEALRVHNHYALKCLVLA
mgnify:CR=1 FL=1